MDSSSIFEIPRTFSPPFVFTCRPLFSVIHAYRMLGIFSCSLALKSPNGNINNTEGHCGLEMVQNDLI